MADRVHDLLDFGFGHLGSADLPSSDRTTLWFGEDQHLKQQLVELFQNEFEEATTNKLVDWPHSPRGRLALIILLDQFPRYVYRRTPQAFAYDNKAQELAMEGLSENMDHSLTLIERVFFYMPLVHAENAINQEKSIRLYQELVTLSI